MKLQQGLNSNQLKLIAILAMTLDHIVWTLEPDYSTLWWVLLCHVIGRVTAPIMWFFVAEGYHHTRSVKRYALRLLSLAVVSHFAYNFCFDIPFLPLQNSVFDQTGVVWSLFWGLCMLWVNDSSRLRDWQKTLFVLLACLLSFPSNWSCVAALSVFFIGANRGNFKEQMKWMMIWSAVYAGVYFLFLDRVYGLLQLCTCLAIPLLRCYNGERGSLKGIGKLFYLYYPAHLALCGVLRLALNG